MKKIESGETFVTIAIIIASIIIAIVLTFQHVIDSQINLDIAFQSAHQFSKKIEDIADINCVAQDSDSDGYCSCSLIKKDGSVISLECGCRQKFYGCKLATFKVGEID